MRIWIFKCEHKWDLFVVSACEQLVSGGGSGIDHFETKISIIYEYESNFNTDPS